MKGLPVAVYINGKQNSLTRIKYIHIIDIEKSPVAVFDVDGYTHSIELEHPGEWSFVYDTGLIDLLGKKIFTNSVCAQVYKSDDNRGWSYADIDENGCAFECYVDINETNACVCDFLTKEWLYAIDNEDRTLSFDFNGQRRQFLIQRVKYSFSEMYFNKHKAVYDTLELV